ncbi:dTDP-4-dehydrorhamnose reductase [Thermicanus aegyptius]|uniref:dTDP-4-dehydrorhamnose reductase n=1 Tax=Thermicanus aegyptius TaxID=94009 RepID=UPI00048C707F|nr:dTDP-4-dehydrorhamnose reductase [Thermicanus aegyptius]
MSSNKSEKKCKVLITGVGGQLGKDLMLLLKDRTYEVYGFSREELDVTDQFEVKKSIEEVHPDVVIHTAAYTKVDQAEEEMDLAFAVNGWGTRNVAVASEEVGAKLVYISTDYVFDGEKGKPYLEYDRTAPLNVYGASKEMGEQMVRDFHSRFFIVRTSWVYGAYGANFVKTMLRLGKEQLAVRVVNDQIGSPTYTVDLAEALLHLIETEKYGIYHLSNSGACSWYEFAKAIFEEVGMQVTVEPIPTEAFPRPAKRPKYSVLDHRAWRLNGFPPMPHWRDGLKRFLTSYIKT